MTRRLAPLLALAAALLAPSGASAATGALSAPVCHALPGGSAGCFAVGGLEAPQGAAMLGGRLWVGGGITAAGDSRGGVTELQRTSGPVLAVADCLADGARHAPACATGTLGSRHVLWGIRDLVASPGGPRLFAAFDDGADRGVVELARDPLAPAGCVVDGGSTGDAACAQVPDLDRPEHLAAHPDGETLYAAGGGTLVALDTTAGLAQRTALSGLGDVRDLAVTPDGDQVLVASEHGLVAARIQASGAVDPSSLACVSPATCGGIADGPDVATMIAPRAIAVSPDGRTVAVAVDGDATTMTSGGIVLLDRDAAGALAAVPGEPGCLAAASAADGCADAPLLSAPPELTFSPDGRSLYGFEIGRLTTFDRDAATRRVTPAGCVANAGSADCDALGTTPFGEPRALVVDPAGDAVYAISAEPAAPAEDQVGRIHRFARDTGGGGTPGGASGSGGSGGGTPSAPAAPSDPSAPASAPPVAPAPITLPPAAPQLQIVEPAQTVREVTMPSFLPVVSGGDLSYHDVVSAQERLERAGAPTATRPHALNLTIKRIGRSRADAATKEIARDLKRSREGGQVIAQSPAPGTVLRSTIDRPARVELTFYDPKRDADVRARLEEIDNRCALLGLPQWLIDNVLVGFDPAEVRTTLRQYECDLDKDVIWSQTTRGGILDPFVTRADKIGRRLAIEVALPKAHDLALVLREAPEKVNGDDLPIGEDGALTWSSTQDNVFTVQVVDLATGRLVQGAEVTLTGTWNDRLFERRQTDGNGETTFRARIDDSAAGVDYLLSAVVRGANGRTAEGFRVLRSESRDRTAYRSMAGRTWQWNTFSKRWGGNRVEFDRIRQLSVVAANLGVGPVRPMTGTPAIRRVTGTLHLPGGRQAPVTTNAVTVSRENRLVAAGPGLLVASGGQVVSASPRATLRGGPVAQAAVFGPLGSWLGQILAPLAAAWDGAVGTVRQALTPQTVDAVRQTGRATGATSGGVPSASNVGLISRAGGNVVSAGGANVVSAGGANVVSAGGGNVIAAGGGNVIAAGGANLMPMAGASVVAAGGGN